MAKRNGPSRISAEHAALAYLEIRKAYERSIKKPAADKKHFQQIAEGAMRLVSDMYPDRALYYSDAAWDHLNSGGPKKGHIWQDHCVTVGWVHKCILGVWPGNSRIPEPPKLDTVEQIQAFIEKHVLIANLMAGENKCLNEKPSLQRDMPSGWRWGGNRMARYKDRGILVRRRSSP